MDVFERPIGGVPGATVKLLERVTDNYCWTFRYNFFQSHYVFNFRYTGIQTEVINVGSYNYLGFAEKDGPCAKMSAQIIDNLGLSVCTSIREQG